MEVFMWCKHGKRGKCDGAYLCAVSLGLAVGITCGLVSLFYGWAGYFWGYGTSMVQMSAMIHYGYTATIAGGLIGGLWGLVEGFIFGFVVGYLYNYIQCCCCKGK